MGLSTKQKQLEDLREFLFGDETGLQIRIIPMSKAELGDDCDFNNFVDVQTKYFLDTLANKQNGRFYRKQGINSVPGSLFLFQYENEIIASAIFQKDVVEPSGEYSGYYLFDKESIKVFEPITSDEMRAVVVGFKGFSQSKQHIPIKYLEDIDSLIEMRSYHESPQILFNMAWEKLVAAAELNKNGYVFQRAKESLKTVYNGRTFKTIWSGGSSNTIAKTEVFNHWLHKPSKVGLTGGRGWMHSAREAVIRELVTVFGLPSNDLAIDTSVAALSLVEWNYEQRHIPKKKENYVPGKRDYEKVAKTQREIGYAGEELVLNYERNRLIKCNREDLVERVKWVSKEIDGLGYDILSFDESGKEMHIEVKSTITSVPRLQFYISAPEADKYFQDDKIIIYFIFDLRNKPKLHIVDRGQFRKDFLTPSQFYVDVDVSAK